MYESLIVMVVGIIAYGLVYQFYVKWFDKSIVQSDPTRPTPAHVYMDGVEFFPSNKYVMLGWHWKSIAALGPVTGPALAIVWGWLPGFLWIVLGNSLMGWLHDYNAMVSSVRNEGASLGPLTYQLVGPRARRVLVAFLAFYTILLFAAFLGALVPVISNPNLGGITSLISFVIVTAIGVGSGYAIFKARLNVLATTIISLVLIAITIAVMQGLLAPGINAAFVKAVPDVLTQQDIILLVMLVFSILGAVLPLWSFAMPINYLGFYIAYFVIAAMMVSSIFVPQSFQAPMFTSLMAPLTFGAGAGVFLFSFPLWPLMFVTIACGACSGWHGLVGSSLTSKQLDNESDAHFVGGGSMLLEGILALTAVVAVASLKIDYTKPLAALGLYVSGGSVYLQHVGFARPVATGIMALMTLVLGLMLTQLALRFSRLTLSEMVGTRAFKNIYLTSIVSSIITYLLVSGRVTPTGLWGFIWALFGGSNQLLAGVSLAVATLWFMKIKRPAWITGSAAVFMIVTTIVALAYTAYATLSIGFTSTGAKAYGSIGGGVIAVILTVLGIMLALDVFKAYGRMKAGAIAAPPTAGPGLTAAQGAPEGTGPTLADGANRET